MGDGIPGGGGGYAIYGRSGGTWSSSLINANPRRDLLDVDCIEADQCWAVGQRRNANDFTFAARNGVNWALEQPTLGGAEDLYGVSCISAGRCLAVGDGGMTLYWDGSGWQGTDWQVVASPSTEDLRDVFYVDTAGGGGGSGAVTLVNWQELVL